MSLDEGFEPRQTDKVGVELHRHPLGRQASGRTCQSTCRGIAGRDIVAAVGLDRLAKQGSICILLGDRRTRRRAGLGRRSGLGRARGRTRARQTHVGSVPADPQHTAALRFGRRHGIGEGIERRGRYGIGTQRRFPLRDAGANVGTDGREAEPAGGADGGQRYGMMGKPPPGRFFDDLPHRRNEKRRADQPRAGHHRGSQTLQRHAVTSGTRDDRCHAADAARAFLTSSKP